MKNILITGGAGFIGGNLALRLSKLGYAVTVLDNLSPQIHGEEPQQSSLFQKLAGKVHFILGDVTRRADMEKALQNQDAVIHLAAETGTGQSMYEIEKYTRVNVGGTALLLDLLVNSTHSVKKLLLASSRAVYGEGKYTNSHGELSYPDGRSTAEMNRRNFEMLDESGEILTPLPTDENAALKPASFYGLTKLQQEQMVQSVCRSLELDYVILRYQNVFGVGQSLLNPYTGILSIFSTQILNDEALNVFEDGEMSRDFIYIDDVIAATVAGLELSAARNEIINVGSGNPQKVIRVAEQLFSNYEKKIDLTTSGDFRKGDIRHNFADLTKACQLLDFQPQVSFERGLMEFCTWVKKEGPQRSRVAESLNEMKIKGFLKG